MAAANAHESDSQVMQAPCGGGDAPAHLLEEDEEALDECVDPFPVESLRVMSLRVEERKREDMQRDSREEKQRNSRKEKQRDSREMGWDDTLHPGGVADEARRVQVRGAPAHAVGSSRENKADAVPQH